MVEASYLRSIATWMLHRDGQALDCTDGRRLQAGTQNLMIAFTRSGSHYVLRQPPRHAIIPSAKSVARETQVLSSLAASNVPHPTLFGSSVDPEALGGPFYVMESIDGFNAIEGLPANVAADEALQQQMGQAAVEALVALSSFDVSAAGLGNLGDARGFLERQVSRWRRQLESYEDFEGWSREGAFTQIEAVATWLSEMQPDRNRAALIHGDYHIGNMLFRRTDAALLAIIDWELATIGDPLVDLGWLIATWPASTGEDTGSGLSVPGATALPKTQALLDHYRAVSGEDPGDVTWFVVLACYKLGILQEGSWARALAGRADRKMGAEQHDRALAMIEKALRLIREHAWDTKADD